MKCKKCGFDCAQEDGDWITCPNCGAKYFNTAINPEMSATRQISEMERQQSAAPAEAQAAEPEGDEKKKKSKLRETIDFMLPIVIAVVIALLLKSFVFANIVVPTGSMISTINEGDRIIASRVAYIKSDPQRYDIILFKFPDDESQIFVKRIIGMPGETVTVENGIAYITDENGNTVETDQSFVTNEKPEGNYGPYYIPKEGEKITVNGTQCIAENGMTVGSLEFLDKYCKKDESGNYTVSEKCYFCMGDNRNKSHDSRFWNNTYVAENKILGQAEFKYYPGFEKLK